MTRQRRIVSDGRLSKIGYFMSFHHEMLCRGAAGSVGTGLIGMLDGSVINTVMLETKFPQIPFPLCSRLKVAKSEML